MASVVGICNRALQKLGAARITALTDDSRNARACNAAYESIRDAELRKRAWNFAVARAVLAPDATAPAFEFDYQFTFPTDCLRLLPPNDNYLDWTIEGRKILTNYGDTLEIRYVQRVTDPNTFDTLFIEALASRIAYELCEEITQSNAKKADALADYRQSIADARQANAFEQISGEPPEDTWVTVRI